jgi:hypothetical protein
MKNQKIHQDNPQPKTGEPKRVVTLALTDKILNVLETFDQDLVQAIMKVISLATQRNVPKGSSFEIIEVAPHKSVFIVGPDSLLTRIPWIKLVEVSPGRNLIAIPSGTSLESLEVAVLEMIESITSDNATEGSFLKEFCKYVGRLRRYNKMSRAEIMIVDTDH